MFRAIWTTAIRMLPYTCVMVSVPDWGFAESNRGSEAILVQLSKNFAMTCELTIKASGGSFAPDVCQFEIISGGPDCRRAAGCRPDYAMALKNANPAATEISS